MANADATKDATPSPTLPLAAALRDAVLSGFVAFGLFFFMIGLRTEQGSTGALEITTRFETFAILVAAVFVGAFLRTLIFGRGAIPFGRAVPPTVARLVGGAGRFAGPALLIFALLVPVLFYQNRYLLDLGILVLTYVMLGWGLNIVVGLAYSPTHRVVFLFSLILALALLTNWVTLRLRRLPVGRAWEAMREDEIACRSLGINTTTTKLTAFAIGAMFAGFAGSFFATRQGFISPESFTFGESALVLAIVVLGGMASQLGVAIAALVMLGGFELFREFQLYRILIFGFAMVLIMIWRPRGLVSTREPSLHLGERKA